MTTAKQARHEAIDRLWDEVLPLARSCSSRDQGTIAFWLRSMADMLDLERKQRALSGTSFRRLDTMRRAGRAAVPNELVDIARFIVSDCAVTGLGEDCVTALDLCIAYYAHCEAKGLEPLAMTVFYRRLPALAKLTWADPDGRTRRFIHSRAAGVSAYRGIRVIG